MGIKGIYREIGPGSRISLCKLAVEHLEQTGRPLRLAVDISIWQFQVQAARGGANPAIRTLFYRLARLLSLSIQAIFVFDGPHKPAFKRHRRSGRGDGTAVASAMAKRLIRLFGFRVHEAPGEAEAECALLQRRGLVDAVLSEDVDTIMFGCTRTLRNWTAEGTRGSKAPTHVSLYESEALPLDREGMVLVALMSGGDYIPEGVPGCGVKVACEAARAGFGASLCCIKRTDTAALEQWRAELRAELRDNESGLFRTRHRALVIPDDFPDPEVLGYYTHPVVSQPSTLDRLAAGSDPISGPVNVAGLRAFVAETFDWTYRTGAIKYIRVLAPGLLVQRMLRTTTHAVPQSSSGGGHVEEETARGLETESELVQSISKGRAHFSTDATAELRVSFVPLRVVPINLSEEEDDPVDSYGRGGLALNSDDELDDLGGSQSTTDAKKPFDPSQPDLVWIPESILKLSVPLTFERWEAAQRLRELGRSGKTSRVTRKPVKKNSDMPAGSLKQYMAVTKRPSGQTGLAAASANEKPYLPEPPMSTPDFVVPPKSRVLPSQEMVALSQDVAAPSRQSSRGASSARQRATLLTQDTANTASSKPATNKETRPPRTRGAPRQQQQQQQPRPLATSSNPWSLAGSQAKPEVTKTSSTTWAPGAKSSSTLCSTLRSPTPPDTILISSSPAAPQPSARAPSPKLPRCPALDLALDESSDDDSFLISSPPALFASPQKHKPHVSKATREGRRERDIDTLPPALSPHKAPSARKGGTTCDVMRKERRHQRSILDFVGFDDECTTRPLPRLPPETDGRRAPASTALIELSDDDDDGGEDDDRFEVSRIINGSPTRCKPAGLRTRRTSSSLPETPTIKKTTTSSSVQRQTHTTRLYMPMKGHDGFFLEREVTRDEADRIMQQQTVAERHEMFQISDSSIIDLTDEP